jgi:hypothetical protein
MIPAWGGLGKANGGKTPFQASSTILVEAFTFES